MQTEPHSAPTAPCQHPSSYDAQDARIVFDALELRAGDVFLDNGCGLGAYALAAAAVVGPHGLVYAYDAAAACIAEVARQAAARDLNQVRAQVVDITRPLPLPDASVTACLLATVLHMPPVTRAMPALFAELRRVLRPGGRVGVIECNQHAYCGPPLPLRLAARRITAVMEASGLHARGITGMGYNYLALFQRPPV